MQETVSPWVSREPSIEILDSIDQGQEWTNDDLVAEDWLRENAYWLRENAYWLRENAYWLRENAYWFNEDFLESHDRSP
jgi:hypothetical protein